MYIYDNRIIFVFFVPHFFVLQPINRRKASLKLRLYVNRNNPPVSTHFAEKTDKMKCNTSANTDAMTKRLISSRAYNYLFMSHFTSALTSQFTISPFPSIIRTCHRINRKTHLVNVYRDLFNRFIRACTPSSPPSNDRLARQPRIFPLTLFPASWHKL